MPQTSTPIAPGAQPFFLPAGPVGVFIIHGYGGSIGDYRNFAERLHAQGYSVSGIRLTGHGQDLHALAHSRPDDWRKSVDDGMVELQRRCSRIVIVGSSFGGTLALDYAERKPNAAAAIVAVNPVVKYKNALLQKIFLSVLQLFTPYYPKFGLSREQRKQYAQLGSSVAWPIRGLFATEALVRNEVWPRLGDIRIPVLLMANDRDPIVHSASTTMLQSQLRSTSVQRIHIPGKTHRPFRDVETTNFMADQVDRFIRHLASSR